MSKLGVFWSVMHRRPQDYAFFKAQQPTVFKILDGGPPDYQWARDNLPNSLVIARDWALSEQHADLLKDPQGTGARHAQEWDKHQKYLGFDRAKTLILGVNEPHVWEPGVPEALRQYTIALCDEATRLGLRVGAMQLSVGWPNNDGPDTPPNWSAWHGVDNAIRANNGALVVHEYWADNGPGENWGWWAGRVLKCPWQVPIVIGEAGIDMYVKDGSVQHLSRGWRGRKSPEQYAGELADYTERMSADSRFVGCAVFAADFANGEWASFDIEPAYQAILATPIRVVTPTPPSTGTQPVTMYVAAPDGVNVRSAPLIESDNILAKIPLGVAVDVEGYDTGLKGEPWARMKLPTGGYGYIRMDLLSTAQPPVAQPTPAPDQPPTPVPTGIIDPRVLEAILQVESGGRTHGADGKPIIRFENHIFKGKLGSASFDKFFKFDPDTPWTNHEWRRNSNDAWRPVHTGKQSDEYEAFEFAKTFVPPDAAYQSISVGAPQVMGFNHKRIGYPSAQAMFESFSRSGNAQLIGMVNYMLSDPALVKAINARDWEGIARGYNGGGNVAEAAAKYKAAYERLGSQ